MYANRELGWIGKVTQNRIIIRYNNNKWGQVAFPTAHNSDSPLFRQLFIPTTHYSDNFLFWQPIILTTDYSDNRLFRQLFILTAHYSDNPLFRQLVVCFFSQKICLQQVRT